MGEKIPLIPVEGVPIEEDMRDKAVVVR